ncbi:hypothetical protein H1235_03550 [Pseudoxanthomonas sp. NC8]|nr:hypothetical protein H1235_03550 [Pseudoxanthomonas sp. NC8]
MIVGQGLLARAFASRYAADPDVIIFASGVSNSLATAAEGFERERAMLVPLLDAGTRLVYFGSCASTPENAASTPYMRHKRAMEELVAASPNGLSPAPAAGGRRHREPEHPDQLPPRPHPYRRAVHGLGECPAQPHRRG